MRIRNKTESGLAIFLVLLLLPALCFAQADDQPRKKIGLVLSGGGARGAAHVGVIKVLDELRIPIDYIAGTSMGAIVGGLYASGLDANELEDAVANADWSRLLADRPPRSGRTFRRKADDNGFLVNFEMGLRKRKLLFPRGLVQGQTLTLELRSLLSEVSTISEFSQLPIPFKAIAADIVSGEEVILESGDLANSIRASMSVPGLLKPVEIDGQLLVDGGIVNNLPIDIVKEMGADILIVVDVGSPLIEHEKLSSPLKITNQMLTILIASQSDRQKQLMSGEDLLITPELGTLGSTEFNRTPEAMDLGERTARKSLDNLAQLSLSPQAYARHRNSVRQSRHGLPMIDSLVVENQSLLSPLVLERRLSDYIGKPLDVDQLEDDIADIYGFDTFQTVDYSVIPSASGNELRVRGKGKAWGPNYLKLGLNLEDDFRGNSNYNIAARLTRTEINRLGGEIRADIVIGDSPQLLFELYQPLDYSSRWFINPKFQYVSTSQSLFSDGDSVALFRSEDTSVSLGVGRNIGNAAEVRLSLYRSFGSAEVQIGDPSFEASDAELTFFELDFQYDTIDSIAIPRSGTNIALRWLGLRDGFGADQSLDAIALNVLKPYTWGKNTLLNWWSLESVVNEGDSTFNAFSLGGLFSLSGYAPEELRGQHSAIGRVLYYRRIGDAVGSLLNTPLYLGASVELGNVWQDTSDINFSSALAAGSVFVAVDSLIGPLYLAYGAAEGGRDTAYLFLGQTF